MQAPGRPLFRREVLEHRNRLHGEISLAIPMSWHVIGFALLAATASALLFLSTANYARVETVAGAIVLDRGTASIVPSRAGIVAALPAREGQRVRAGDPLVRIRAEEDMASGTTAPVRRIDALRQRDDRLASRSSLTLSAAAEEQARARAEQLSLTQEIDSIDGQIAQQRRLVEVAEGEYRDVQGIARQGFISRRDLDAREVALVARRQQLSRLEQVRAAKAGDLAQARRAIAQIATSAQAQAAAVDADRAEVAEHLAEVEQVRGYTLTSPVDGIVAAVTARLGQPATQDRPLMVLVPLNATTQAELYVPTSAAGFLAVGQPVRLAVDAFPYQRFGTTAARIVRISAVAVPRPDASGTIVPVYLVTARLAAPWVVAFGQRQPLVPGMTLSARIVTRDESLFEWLFEPLFAVRRR